MRGWQLTLVFLPGESLWSGYSPWGHKESDMTERLSTTNKPLVADACRIPLLSHVRLFVTLWTVAHQASQSMGFSRQKYCSGLSFPTPRDLPDPGIKHTSLASPVLAGNFFTTEPLGKPLMADDTCLLFVPIAC